MLSISYSRIDTEQFVEVGCHVSPSSPSSTTMADPYPYARRRRSDNWTMPREGSHSPLLTQSSTPTPRPSALSYHVSDRSSVSWNTKVPSATVRDTNPSTEYGKPPLVQGRHREHDNHSFAVVLVHNDGHDHRPLHRPNHTLRYWCYGLHAFLILIHIALFGLLFTHPEHRFSVPANSTVFTVGLSAFLQAFYTVRPRVLFQ